MTRKEIDELIDQFNAQVGNKGWTSARAEYDMTLIDAMKEAGIDISAIYDGKAILFKNKIALNEDGNKLVVIDDH